MSRTTTRAAHASALAALAAIPALALAVAGCGSSTKATTASASSPPVTVRVGYFPNITHGVALVGVAQGIFAKDLGRDHLDASQTFSAGPAENQALLPGSIDVAFEGPSSALSAYTSSGGAVQIVAGAASGGAGLVVKSGIDDPSQLAGSTLASPQLGNTQDVALRTWLKAHGFTTSTTGGGDVAVQPSSTGNGTIVTEFKAGQIAGAWVPQPYEAEMVAAGGHVLIDEASLWPGGKFATTDVVVRTDFAKAHPATLRRLLTGLVDTVDAITADPTGTQRAADAQLASLQGGKPLPASVLSSSWSSIDFTVDPLAATIAKEEANGVATGLVKPVGDLSGIFDLGPLDAVLQAKGKPAVPAS